MPYKIEFNDSAYMTAPTLGDLVSAGSLVQKIKVETDYIFWAQDDGYWFSQASGGSSRELGVYRLGGDISVYVGGTSNTIGAVSTIFGATAIDGSLALELDLVALTYSLSYNGSVVKTGAIADGSARTDAAWFRLGARSSSFSAPSQTGTYLFQTGEQLGDTRVYLDTGSGYVLERSYVIPATGTAIPDTSNAQDGTMRGTFSDVQLIEYGAPTATPSIAPAITPASIDAASTSVYGTFTFDSASNTGDAVTAYEVRVDGGVWQNLGIPSPFEFTVTGLTSSTVYNTPGVEVRAVNGSGAGPASSAETFETSALPAVPINLSKSNILSTSVRLMWERG